MPALHTRIAGWERVTPLVVIANPLIGGCWPAHRGSEGHGGIAHTHPDITEAKRNHG